MEKLNFIEEFRVTYKSSSEIKRCSCEIEFDNLCLAMQIPPGS